MSIIKLVGNISPGLSSVIGLSILQTDNMFIGPEINIKFP